MKFLANENFPLLSIRILRAANHHVFSVIQEAPGSKDEDILKRAHVEDLIILTFDRDYGELIFRHRTLLPAGVVYFRFSPATPAEPGDIFLNILAQGIISIGGMFTVIERGRIRQRTFDIANRKKQ